MERVKLFEEFPGVTDEDAHEMLRRTQNPNWNYSAYRASNLLQVLRPAYRTADLVKRFGANPVDDKIAYEVWKVAFYADSSLEAIELLEKERECTPLSHSSSRMTPEQAAKNVVDAKEKELRKKIANEQMARRFFANCDKNVDAEEPVKHFGFACDVSNQSPIIGVRFNKRGTDYDLCEAEFNKLSPEEQNSFDRIEKPVPSTQQKASSL